MRRKLKKQLYVQFQFYYSWLNSLSQYFRQKIEFLNSVTLIKDTDRVLNLHVKFFHTKIIIKLYLLNVHKHAHLILYEEYGIVGNRRHKDRRIERERERERER
jgi:hypothetical protein